jgi:hypothetical protein
MATIQEMQNHILGTLEDTNCDVTPIVEVSDKNKDNVFSSLSKILNVGDDGIFGDDKNCYRLDILDEFIVARKIRNNSCGTPYGQYCTKCGILHIDTSAARSQAEAERIRADAYAEWWLSQKDSE